MYQSRLHATNGIVSLAVDALSGEILEFVRESTKDNAVMNHQRQTYSLLEAMLYADGQGMRIHPPRYLDIRADSTLAPVIRVDQQEGSARVEMDFPALVGESGRVDIAAHITVELPENDCRTHWHLTLTNGTSFEVDDVAFPSVTGLWLGDTWTDDRLIMPRFSGLEIVNPTQALPDQPPRIKWKWQEYLFDYNLGQTCGKLDDRGMYTLRMNYSGEASMVWMDLYDPTECTGIYLTCRNQNLSMKSVRAEAAGETDPGIGLAILHHPCLQNGTWQSDECVLAFHEGDWHWAADDYRAWFDTLQQRADDPFSPAWFQTTPGLMAHYDFQYQGGGIVHRFTDIPHLLEMAQGLGYNYLLLSGWNEDGFDFGFPHYRPNPKLGTPEELRQSVLKCREMGGHVAFYVNSRLCNTGFEDQQERIRHQAVMQRSGDLWIEKYGAADVYFASMCINAAQWRDFLCETVRYLNCDIGADSIYLDQFAMATSVLCYHPEHTEHAGHPAAWNDGYRKLQLQMEKQLPPHGLALLIEGCNDSFGRMTAGQLITTLGGSLLGQKPEVYKYTFPEQQLMDMMNPRRHSAMRAEHVARKSTFFLYRAFTVGSFFWCYDLEWDNNWRGDAEQADRLRNLTQLRRSWLEHYGQGRFRDNIGILAAPDDQMIKRYELPDGAALLACASESGLGGEVKLIWSADQARAEVMTMSDPNPVPCACSVQDGQLTVTLPADEACVIVLKP